MVEIERLDAPGMAARLEEFAGLLQAVVDAGASVGFLPPLDRAEALAYWRGVVGAVRGGERVALGAFQAGRLVGTGQLDLCQRPNGVHRAEVMKLLVHPDAQRQGIGRALMAALEAEARAERRATLFLDTRQGDPSERLYQSLGWTQAGVIPQWALNGDGGVDPTVVYYKLLD